MNKMFWKITLIISFLIIFIFGCNVSDSFNTDFLEKKECDYKLTTKGDTIFLKYYLKFDTSTFELLKTDTSKFTIFQSAYFAWYVKYLSYRVLNLNDKYNYVVFDWQSDSLLQNTLFTIKSSKSNLNKEFDDTLHYNFVKYLIDSITVRDYFIYNNVLHKLYLLFGDSRLTWNYSYLISQYEKHQCGNPQKDVSYEVFVLLNIGINTSNLNDRKKKELIRHNKFFMRKCSPEMTLINKNFEILKIEMLK